MTRNLLIAATLLASGCAMDTQHRQTAAEDPKVTQALAGKVAGKPRSCLSLTDARNSETYDGTILYRVNRNLIYRNDAGGCSGLDEDRIPVTNVHGGQLCRGDIMTLVDRGSGGSFGSCALGDFVPYSSAPTR